MRGVSERDPQPGCRDGERVGVVRSDPGHRGEELEGAIGLEQNSKVQ